MSWPPPFLVFSIAPRAITICHVWTRKGRERSWNVRLAVSHTQVFPITVFSFLLPLRAGLKRRHGIFLRDNVQGITKPVRSFAFISLPLLDSANHRRRQFAAGNSPQAIRRLARRAGVKLPPSKKASKKTRKQAARDIRKGSSARKAKTSVKRSRATSRALKREGRSAASKKALSRQARSAAAKRSAASRSRAAKKAAKTRKK